MAEIKVPNEPCFILPLKSESPRSQTLRVEADMGFNFKITVPDPGNNTVPWTEANLQTILPSGRISLRYTLSVMHYCNYYKMPADFDANR